MSPHNDCADNERAKGDGGGTVGAVRPLPALSSLLDRHGDDLARYLVGLVGPDDAADCFQDTVLNAVSRYGRVSHDDNLRGWLFSVAHSTALDRFRAEGRRPEEPSERLPERCGALGERDIELWAAVDRLPAKQRHAVALRFLADMPYREIATVVGCSEPAARQNVRAGLASLRSRHDDFAAERPPAPPTHGTRTSIP